MLTLSDCKLGLDDLFAKRHAALVKSKAGKYHEAELDELRASIDGLPPELTGGTPLAAELEAADDRHDEAGRVVFFATEAVLHDKGAAADAVAAARAVRSALLPGGLAQLVETFADEAAAARARRPLLKDKALKAALALIPLPGDRTLADAATAFLDAGDELDALLSARGDAGKPDRSGAARLRSQAIGALNQLRKALTKEVAKDPKLPRDLVAQVFGYLDTLEAARATAKKPAPAAPPAPPIGDEPTDPVG